MSEALESLISVLLHGKFVLLAQERAPLDQQHAAEFASGVWPEDLKTEGKRAELLQDVQSFLTGTQQVCAWHFAAFRTCRHIFWSH